MRVGYPMTPLDPNGLKAPGATMSGMGDEAAELERRFAEVLSQHFWDRFDGCGCGHYVGDTAAWSWHAAEVLASESTVTEYIDGLVDAASDRAEQQAVWDEDRRWLDQGEE